MSSPTETTMYEQLHWSSESLVLRGDAIFGYGWLFHEAATVGNLHLEIRFVDGQAPCIIAAEYGKSRIEIAQSFVEFSTARQSGYLIYGTCTQALSRRSGIFLCGMLDDGSIFERELAPPQLTIIDEAAAINRYRALGQQAAVLFVRGVRLLRQGQYAMLLEKARRYLRGRRAPAAPDAPGICALLTTSERGNVHLIVDHDLGGGANQYRQDMVAAKIAQGVTVLVLSYHVGTLTYLLMVRNRRLEERLAIANLDVVRQLGQRLRFGEIVYNTAVSFTRPEDIPSLLVELKKQCAARLVLLVHDFFMACPSHFLLNDQGVYCGIPDEATCQRCLAKNQQGFAALFAARDIRQWRAVWGVALQAADEIRTFSNNSHQLLQRAYPQLKAQHVTLVPHEVKHLAIGAIVPAYTTSLRIGVVGHIGYPKGAHEVAALAREILRRGLDTQIVVIGAIEAACPASVVRETGPYQHAQLPALIQQSGVNIMLFPSIVPETFSYVAQELMELKLPIACFNLGAPAERLAGYDKGLILQSREAAAVLDALLAFHQKVYLENSGH